MSDMCPATCTTCHGKREAIGCYYHRCDLRRQEAEALLDEARERGASLSEIRMLKEDVLIAGDTGD